MKNKIKKAAIISVMIFCAAGQVFAGDSAYISISCTIPAIPGLNAPIISEKMNEQTENAAVTNQEESKEPLAEIKDKIIPQELPEAKKNNIKHLFFLSEENTAGGLLQTVYSR